MSVLTTNGFTTRATVATSWPQTGATETPGHLSKLNFKMTLFQYIFLKVLNIKLLNFKLFLKYSHCKVLSFHKRLQFPHSS